MASAGEVIVYYILQVVSGHVLLPLLLAIFALSPKINRHPTLLNLIIAYIISSIIACLLYDSALTWRVKLSDHMVRLYAGRAIGPEPSPVLCVVQAGLINSSVLLPFRSHDVVLISS
jgi:hypothetical protein